MSELEFDEATHTYSVSGKQMSSVTRILKSAGLIDERWFSDEGARRGSYAHKALELYDQSDLDEETLDPGLVPYLDAWKKFRSEFPCEILAVEERVVHPVYSYAGTLDRRVKLKGKDEKAVIDLKTGEPQNWHAVQTAAYAMAFDEPMRRFGVYLSEGGFKLVEHKDRNDYNVFKACLTIHNFKARNS